MSQHFGSYFPVHSFPVPDGVMDRICHSVIRNRKPVLCTCICRGRVSAAPAYAAMRSSVSAASVSDRDTGRSLREEKDSGPKKRSRTQMRPICRA